MQMRPWIPLLLALATFGCGVERKLVGSAPEESALQSGAASAEHGRRIDRTGAVYVMSNATAGNAILAFSRGADGRLTGPMSYSTGGAGTGGGLGNQGSIAFGGDHRWLFTVNAASNDVSMFRIGASGLRLVTRVPSGGTMPTSLTVHDDLLFVLNAGGAGNIQGFRIDSNSLRPIRGSRRPLSSPAAGPAQIGFTPDGDALVVTEKATNKLSIYEVGDHGAVRGPHVEASSGTTPFGFGFDDHHTLIVSEAFGGAANGSAVSSYRVDHDGDLRARSASVPTTQTAACWIAVSENGRWAYAANAGSASITGYAVSGSGRLMRLDAGVTAHTGMGPTELAFSDGSRYLYVLSGGAHTVNAYAVGADGKLEPIGEIGGVPAGANGLAAR